ncbi:hypothetical protein L494_0772, partial [Bordetella bronchiseptica CA90 BB1334]
LAALAAAGADAAGLLWVSDAPAGVAALAQGRPGLCARERDGRTDLAWRAPWRPEDFASGGPHPSVQALQQRLGAAGLLADAAQPCQLRRANAPGAGQLPARPRLARHRQPRPGHPAAGRAGATRRGGRPDRGTRYA